MGGDLDKNSLLLEDDEAGDGLVSEPAGDRLG